MSMNMDRHVKAHIEMYRLLAEGDREKAGILKAFYDEYFAVLDLDADFYLETVQRVFQEHHLARGLVDTRQARGVGVLPDEDELRIVGRLRNRAEEGLAHELAAQLPAQPIFRKQRLGRARKRSGLVLAHPQQFRCLKAWKHAVSCSSQECGETRLMVMQTRADVSAARIVPQNCGAHNIAAPIKRDESVHLSRQPNRFDARACVWNARSDFFDRANS